MSSKPHKSVPAKPARTQNKTNHVSKKGNIKQTSSSPPSSSLEASSSSGSRSPSHSRSQSEQRERLRHDFTRAGTTGMAVRSAIVFAVFVVWIPLLLQKVNLSANPRFIILFAAFLIWTLMLGAVIDGGQQADFVTFVISSLLALFLWVLYLAMITFRSREDLKKYILEWRLTLLIYVAISFIGGVTRGVTAIDWVIQQSFSFAAFIFFIISLHRILEHFTYSDTRYSMWAWKVNAAAMIVKAILIFLNVALMLLIVNDSCQKYLPRKDAARSKPAYCTNPTEINIFALLLLVYAMILRIIESITRLIGLCALLGLAIGWRRKSSSRKAESTLATWFLMDLGLFFADFIRYNIGFPDLKNKGTFEDRTMPMIYWFFWLALQGAITTCVMYPISAEGYLKEPVPFMTAEGPDLEHGLVSYEDFPEDES